MVDRLPTLGQPGVNSEALGARLGNLVLFAVAVSLSGGFIVRALLRRSRERMLVSALRPELTRLAAKFEVKVDAAQRRLAEEHLSSLNAHAYGADSSGAYWVLVPTFRARQLAGELRASVARTETVS